MQIPFTPFRLIRLRGVGYPIHLPAVLALFPGCEKQPETSVSKDQMPLARAFWSVTLYDSKNGFLIPNDRKKYSVGKNGSMQLNDQGGIEIYVAAEKPESVAEENWLPINRGDEALDLVMRIYAPDLEEMKTWTPPKAERLQ